MGSIPDCILFVRLFKSIIAIHYCIYEFTLIAVYIMRLITGVFFFKDLQFFYLFRSSYLLTFSRDLFKCTIVITRSPLSVHHR